jgi:hypothetical protein
MKACCRTTHLCDEAVRLLEEIRVAHRRNDADGLRSARACLLHHFEGEASAEEVEQETIRRAAALGGPVTVVWTEAGVSFVTGELGDE